MVQAAIDGMDILRLGLLPYIAEFLIIIKPLIHCTVQGTSRTLLVCMSYHDGSDKGGENTAVALFKLQHPKR